MVRTSEKVKGAKERSKKKVEKHVKKNPASKAVDGTKKKRKRSLRTARNSKINGVMKKNKYQIPAERLKRAIKKCEQNSINKKNQNNQHLLKNYRYSKYACVSIQACVEKIIKNLFAKANLYALQGKRVTVQVKDLMAAIKADKNLFQIATRNNSDFTLVPNDAFNLILNN